MKYETVKSFILVVLVGISFLLSFILWSYQPNYESLYNTNYVNEVDIGGNEKTKNELIEPTEIIFKDDEQFTSFMNPVDRQSLYKEIASWVIYEPQITGAKGRPTDEQYVELIFPSAIPADLIGNLFSFNSEIDPPAWSFERVFIIVDEKSQSLELKIVSVDGRNQVNGTIEKSDAYKRIVTYLSGSPILTEYIAYDAVNGPIYLQKDKVKIASKTLVASNIKPDSFIDALFSDPSYVTPNIQEAYFTDGQRGMRVLQEGRLLNFINPIQSDYKHLTPIELFDKSVANINEHKGWTNDFLFEGLDVSFNYIRYRLFYEGYPVFDYHNLSVMEQEWRDQELYQYNRPLVRVGNLLNSKAVEIPSGEEVIRLIKGDKSLRRENIKDIRVGYSLSYLDDAHSLTLEPNWYILYQGDWMKIDTWPSNDAQQTKGGE